MKIIKSLLGKILFRLKRLFFYKTHLEFSGPYESWDIAYQNSVGYDSKLILDKIKKSIFEVLENKKSYERDGTSFSEKPLHNTLIKTLEQIGIKNRTIVDFGGSLGSNYINYRDFFSSNIKTYYIVEQKEICILGREIASKYNLPINYVEKLDEINEKIDIIIFSSSLQYIENWKYLIKLLQNKKPEFILIDRHPLTDDKSKIWVQLNTNYYEKPVTYPLHIVNEEEFLSEFKGYKLMKKWISDFDPEYFKGFLFEKN